MSLRNFLSRALSNRHTSNNTQLDSEAALPQSIHDDPDRPSQPQKRESSYNLLRIPLLLMLGYPSEETTRQCVFASPSPSTMIADVILRYELKRDWTTFYNVLMLKIDNITIVVRTSVLWTLLYLT
jgi:hypothetical protein